MLPAADADRDVFPAFVRWARGRGATSFGVVEYVMADPGDASRWLSRTPEPGSWAADGLFLVPAFGPLRARFARPADAFYDGIHFSAAGADATARAISDSLRERWPECARRMEGKRDGAR
jgi:lysophospholipase L1-like esterase